MKNKVSTLLIVFGLSFGVYAQEKSLNTNFGIGLQVGQYQRDFGIGLNITSPYFAGDNIAIRMRANNLWNEHLDNKDEVTWTSYLNLSFGIISIAGEIGKFARLYGEGGILLLFPSDKFSSKSSDIGGYGLFGFEFFMSHYTNYFIEIGGVGTGAVADKIIGKPIYSNGLIINTGFRAQF